MGRFSPITILPHFLVLPQQRVQLRVCHDEVHFPSLPDRRDIAVSCAVPQGVFRLCGIHDRTTGTNQTQNNHFVLKLVQADESVVFEFRPFKEFLK